jgi:hypothetical protein
MKYFVAKLPPCPSKVDKYHPPHLKDGGEKQQLEETVAEASVCVFLAMIFLSSPTAL